MVAWAIAALDEVRRDHWRDARKTGASAMIRRIKGCRYALLMNPENLTEHQQTALAKVAARSKTLDRVYLLKEQFRLVFQLRRRAAARARDDWLRKS